jgi:single-strand DNA-binding protein
MSRGFNRVVLIGNVGKEPEIRYTGTGIAVATFSLATSELWRDKDGNQQERTDWHNIVAWRKLAEIIQEIVHKGSRVLVEGKIQNRSYEKGGEKRYITEIIADNILLLDSREGTAAPPSAFGSNPSRQQHQRDDSTSAAAFDTLSDDDLPF